MRRLSTFLYVLSLVLCVAMVVLWVRSLYFDDTLSFPLQVTGTMRDGQTDDRWLESNLGELHYAHHAIGFQRGSNQLPIDTTPGSWFTVPADPERTVGRKGLPRLVHRFSVLKLGVQTYAGSSTYADNWSSHRFALYSVPYWLLVAVTGFPCLRWLFVT